MSTPVTTNRLRIVPPATVTPRPSSGLPVAHTPIPPSPIAPPQFNDSGPISFQELNTHFAEELKSLSLASYGGTPSFGNLVDAATKKQMAAAIPRSAGKLKLEVADVAMGRVSPSGVNSVIHTPPKEKKNLSQKTLAIIWPKSIEGKRGQNNGHQPPPHLHDTIFKLLCDALPFYEDFPEAPITTVTSLPVAQNLAMNSIVQDEKNLLVLTTGTKLEAMTALQEKLLGHCKDVTHESYSLIIGRSSNIESRAKGYLPFSRLIVLADVRHVPTELGYTLPDIERYAGDLERDLIDWAAQQKLPVLNQDQYYPGRETSNIPTQSFVYMVVK